MRSTFRLSLIDSLSRLRRNHCICRDRFERLGHRKESDDDDALDRREALHDHPYPLVINLVVRRLGVTSDQLDAAIAAGFEGHEALVEKLCQLDGGPFVEELYGNLVANHPEVAAKVGLDVPPDDEQSELAQPAPDQLSILDVATDDEQPAVADDSRLTWQDAAERLERLRQQGEPWKGHHHYARQFSCSSSVTHRAVKETESLHLWAGFERNKTPKPRRGGSIDVALEEMPQQVEPAPVVPLEDADMKQLMQRCKAMAKTPELLAELEEWKSDPEKMRQLSQVYEQKLGSI